MTYVPEYLISTFAGGVSISRVDPNGDGGPATQVSLGLPRGVAADAAGNVFVSQPVFGLVFKITPDGTIKTFAGGGTAEVTDGASARAVLLRQPSGLAVDSAGTLYIAESLSYRVVKVTPDGKIFKVAGGSYGYSGDGGPATAAQMSAVPGVGVDAAGNVYIADAGNHRIRKVTSGSAIITTVAGNGSAGYGGDGGPATGAMLNAPQSVRVDDAGNLYIADTSNSLVRKVTADGAIRTVAGIPNFPSGFSGDCGAAVAAQLQGPYDLALDPAGNLLIADAGNNCVRRVKPNGVISTVAGLSPVLGLNYGYYRGEGVAATWATLAGPVGVAADRAGNIFVAEGGSGRVRKLVPYTVNAQPVVAVSAASFSGAALAAESITAAFGTNLSAATLAAASTPLPTALGGTTVKVRDSEGAERFAPLFFVSPGQVNYQIPRGTAAGAATMTVTSGGQVSTGMVQITAVSPSLFAADATGQGVAAAVALRVKSDGSQTYEPVARYDAAQNRLVAVPVDLGDPADQVFLILFGTGLRHHGSLTGVTAQLGGEGCEVIYAGPQGGFVGLDQVNLRVPRSLAGRGEVGIALTVDGKAANAVRVSFR